MWKLIPLLFLLSCSKPPAITHFRGIAHTLPYHIQVAGSLSSREKEQIKRVIDATFEEIDKRYNHWNEYSELSRFNRRGRGKPLPLSEELAEVLREARKITEMTSGRYDPTLGAVIKLWKDALGKGYLPKIGPIATGWSHLRESPEGWVKEDASLAIDLDGMIKGFTVDLLLERLGYPDLYVDWGGDIRAKGREWRILIPSPENKPIAYVNLNGEGLASSGDYLNCWEVEGKRYHHIIDVETLRAGVRREGSIVSVTVRAPSCMLSDALATACMGHIFHLCSACKVRNLNADTKQKEC